MAAILPGGRVFLGELLKVEPKFNTLIAVTTAFRHLRLVKPDAYVSQGSACSGERLQPEERSSGSLESLAKTASLSSRPAL
ncbi:hypothetical protein [Levilactobacillus suantsaiihabitans]|uniref:hypothetical protein n=1 Tax=Levilactobacillus suantsaiihabitans TaxID=2487722 RepID=UPI00107EF329|nr:hypothetical protein [Levilactobacillus suantsaiihabitans]